MDISFRATDRQPWRSAQADIKDGVAFRFPTLRTVGRSRFVMMSEFVRSIRQGRKSTTIRFDERGVEFPESALLPLYSVERGETHAAARNVGTLRILQVRYAILGELGAADARADGYASKWDLLAALASFYPSLTATSLVCVYKFEFDGEAHRRSLDRPSIDRYVA